MAQLNLVSSTTVTSNVASVSLTGIDATYDIYRIIIFNARPDDVAGNSWQARWLVSGSPETGNTYYTQWYRFRYSSVQDDVLYGGLATDYRYNGNTVIYLGDGSGDTNECFNSKIDLYKAYDSDSEGRLGIESLGTSSSNTPQVAKGGSYRKAKQQYNGLQIFCSGYNIASGTFSLYGYNETV
tara:strand:- start:380 stop:928 length:549 start_codon:yes stop_codon:yes gene_type:complete